MSLSIELLNTKKHDRSSFTCGVDSLDDYIKTRASQELKKRVSTPYVLTDSPARLVLGYYCLSDRLAAVAMVVDAITQSAASFYQDYGFIEFPDAPMKLYISMVEIEKLGL